MISKSRIKLIHSLELKKYRKETRLFVAEGHKLTEDLLPCFECEYIAARREWLDTHRKEVERLRRMGVETDEVTQDELQRASLLRNPQDIIAIFRQPEIRTVTESVIKEELCLALDGVQDPGNLGTIVRIADWFGFRHIFCSADTADVYNPKTVQATMGALARVQVQYVDLEAMIRNLKDIPVYGTFLDGDNIYERTVTSNGLIVMGNEGNGISPSIRPYVTERLLVPNYPAGSPTSESLNVAVATAVVCAEFRRRYYR